MRLKRCRVLVDLKRDQLKETHAMRLYNELRHLRLKKTHAKRLYNELTPATAASCYLITVSNYRTKV
jgi:hypothetical protein